MLDKTQDNRTAQKTDLSRIDAAFCDSWQALVGAFGAGLRRDAAILTRSPALLMRNDIKTFHLDARAKVDKAVLDAHFLGTSAFLADCFAVLQKVTELAPFSGMACREIWNWQQRALFAVFLEETDFVEPRAVVDPVTSHPFTTRRLQLPWRKLLAHNRLARIVDVPVTLESFEAIQSGPESVVNRLRIRGIEHFLWQLAVRSWARMPARVGRKQFYYTKDSEIVRDVGLAFAKHGYRIGRIAMPGVPEAKNMHPLARRIVELLQDRIEQRWRPITVGAALPPLLTQLRADLSKQLHAYDVTRAHFESERDRLFPRRGAMVVSNYPYGGAALALAHAAESAGAVFAAVQHGINRELLQHRQNECNYENTGARYALLFNDKARAVTAENRFRWQDSQVTSIGLTRDFVRTARRAFVKGTAIPDVLYVQMLDRTGSFFNGGIYKNDFESCRNECRLVRDVLGNIPHAVGFKFYPYRSYADIDPVRRTIDECPNVSVVDSGIDLRFMLGNARLVIVVGMSSTLSWVLGSGKPLVFLDPAADGYRISPDVRERCPEAMFYFDVRDGRSFEDLRGFLSQPLEDIESRWRKGQEKRARFRAEYLGRADGRTGERAYEWLRRLVRQ
jgi:hypothetical protein